MRTRTCHCVARDSILEHDMVGSGENLPEIGVPAIQKIIYLAASTMDLDILETRTLGKNEKRYVCNLKIQSSNLLEKLRKSKF